MTARMDLESTSAIVSKYQRSLDVSPDAVVVARRDGRALWMNATARRSLDNGVVGLHLLDLVDDRERERVADMFDQLVGGRRIDREAVQLRRLGVDDRWYLWSGELVEDEVLLFGRDVTEERRERELVATEQWIMRAVLRGRPLREIAREACETIERLVRDCGCSVKALTPESDTLRLIAHAGVSEGLSRAIEETPLDESGGGCAAAVRARGPVLTDDVSRDSRWASLREWAVGAGVRSHWATPLIDDAGTVVGALSLYFHRDRAPREWETAIGRRLAAVLALAVVFERGARVSARERGPSARQAL